MIAARRGVLLVAAVLVSAALTPGGARATEAEPTRVLIVGDSVTQGSTGDWTWRYRLWKHLEGTAVDFVGPDSETSGYAGSAPMYADPDFDTDHAARWGRWAAEGRTMIGGLVEGYDPDVVVVNLGVNDILWDTSVDTTIFLLKELVQNAQAVDPGVDVVLSELVQTWLLTGPYGTESRVVELNARLPALADALATDTSSVIVAAAADGFTEGDTYDGTHPNASGEVRLAAAVADALAEVGVGGRYQRPLPAVPATPSVAPTVTVGSGDRTAEVSWAQVPGATSYTVAYRPAGSRSDWSQVPEPGSGPVQLTGLSNGTAYSVRVQAWKGASAGAVSVSAVLPQAPTPAGVEQPDQVEPPSDLGVVTGLRARRAKRSLTVTWSAASGATEYRVVLRRGGRPVRSQTVTGVMAVVGGLAAGRRYVVSVRPRSGALSGPPVRGVFTTRKR